MTGNSKLTKLSLGALLLISTASVVLRCIAIIKYYNPDNGYFEDKTLINIANVMVISAVAIFLISGFFGKKKENLRFNFSSPISMVSSGILAIAVAFLGASLAIRAKARTDAINAVNGSPDLLSILEIVLAILSLLTVIYLIACTLGRSRHSSKRAMLGLCAAIFFAVYAIYLYFESSLPINAPNKIVDQMAYLFTAIFFLFETRISLGRELWRPYVAIGLVSATLCLYASVPAAIVYFANGFSEKALVSNSVFDFALIFFVGAYVIMRVLQYALLRKDEESNFILALRSHADEIEERISTKEENERLEYIALINKIGEENAIIRAKEAARLAKEAKIAEEARLAEAAARAEEADNEDGFIQESIFDLAPEASAEEAVECIDNEETSEEESPAEAETSTTDEPAEASEEPIAEDAVEGEAGEDEEISAPEAKEATEKEENEAPSEENQD